MIRISPQNETAGRLLPSRKPNLIYAMSKKMKNDDIDKLVSRLVADFTPEELALGFLRYEALRRVRAPRFSEMLRQNLAGEFFDDIVTDELLKWKSQ